MEGQLALGSLLHRFPQLRLAIPSEQLHWGHGDGLVLRGLSELPVIPGPALRAPLTTGSWVLVSISRQVCHPSAMGASMSTTRLNTESPSVSIPC